MWATSNRWRAALPGVARWARSVEWSLDGRTWSATALHEGTVRQDATSQTRWSLDAVVSGVEVGHGAVSPFGVLLRGRIGMVHGPDDIEWLPAGLYRTDLTGTVLRDDRVHVTGESFEVALIDDEFPGPRQIDGGSAKARLAQLIRETMPSARVNTDLVDDVVLPSWATQDDSRWGVIDGRTDSPSIARALGAVVYADRAGTFVAAPTPSLEDAPVATYDEGEGGLLLTSGEELSREGVYNRVAVTGESTDPDVAPVGPVVVEDTDRLSPTYTGADPLEGGFGPVTYHYSSPLITSQPQAVKTGRSILAPLLGLKQQVTFTGATDPALDAGDVVLARSPSGLRPVLLDSIEINLATMTMTGACRSTRTRYAGSTVSVGGGSQ